MAVSGAEFRQRMKPVSAKAVAADPRLVKLGWISVLGVVLCGAATLWSIGVFITVNPNSIWVPEFDQRLFLQGFSLIHYLAPYLLAEQVLLLFSLLFLNFSNDTITKQRTLLYFSAGSWLN